MRVGILILMFVVLISGVSALCEEGQININTASAEKLDEIKWVGLPVAGYIIDARPFNSLDELVNISYITEGRLEEIKSQGLACVGEEEIQEEPPEETEEEEEPAEEEEEEETTKEKNVIEEYQETVEIREEETGPIELNIINLNPKVIKSENDNEKLNNSYAIYGFVIFCVLIIVLFVLRKNKYKNEFR